MTERSGAGLRIALASFGTRGDVQPFVRLGRKLADRGLALLESDRA